MIEKIQKLYEKYKSFIVYVIFGVLTTAVSWVTHFGAEKVFGVSVGVATTISWICAVTFAFVTNKTIVFKSKADNSSDLFRQIWQFYAARLASLGIEVSIMYLCADRFREFFIHMFGLRNLTYGQGMLSIGLLSTPEKLNEVIFKVIVASLVNIVLNYVLSKFIVFKKKKVSTDEPEPIADVSSQTV